MKAGTLPPMGGSGVTVEIDETFIGAKYKKPEGARGYAHKNAVLTLVAAWWRLSLLPCGRHGCRRSAADHQGECCSRHARHDR